MLCQSSSFSTPSADKGTGKCSTCAPPVGLSCAAEVTRTSPAGEPLAKGLTALTRLPPSTFSAVPFDASQSLAPVATSTSSPAPTFSSTALPARPPQADPPGSMSRTGWNVHYPSWFH